MNKVVLEVIDYPLQTMWATRLVPNPHIHKEIEIVYVKNGYAQCYADNKIYEIKTGDMFISFPNQIHYYLNSELGEYAVFIFSADILHNLKNTFFENIPKSNILHTDNPSRKIIFSIANEKGDFKETIQVGLLNVLVPKYLETASLEPKRHTKSENLQKILNYCSQHFTDEISLSSVAEALHFSKYYISHLLNQKLNIGFSKYINTLRINKAMQLMQQGEENITFISENVGFGTIRSFNRAFMQIANTTPTAYCKQCTEKNYTPYF